MRGLPVAASVLVGALCGCAALSRYETPAPAPNFPVRVPVFEQARLPNGLTVLSHEERLLPLVSLALVVPRGRLGAGQAGLPGLTLRWLTSTDADPTLDAELDALGAQLVLWEREDGSTISMQVLQQDVERSIALLARVAQRVPPEGSAFTELVADWQRHPQLEARPAYLAELALRAQLLPPGHPYLLKRSGAAPGYQDLVAYHRQTVTPGASSLVVVGRIQAQEVLALARRHFGEWRGPASGAALEPAPAPAVTRREIACVAVPGLTQTVLRAARVTVPAGHPHEVILDMASMAISVAAAKALRYEQGSAYAVSAAQENHRGAGWMVLRASVDARHTRESLKALLAALHAPMTLSGFSAVEIAHSNMRLQSYRQSVLMQMLGSLESQTAQLVSLGELFLLGRRPDYFARYFDATLAVEPLQVAEVAAPYLKEETYQLAIVGDEGVIRSQVPPLGLGPLRFYRAADLL